MNNSSDDSEPLSDQPDAGQVAEPAAAPVGPLAEAVKLCRWSWVCTGCAYALTVLSCVVYVIAGRNERLGFPIVICWMIALAACGVGVGLAILAMARVLTRLGSHWLSWRDSASGPVGIVLQCLIVIPAAVFLMFILARSSGPI
jgi:hypothetical protein